ncbi:DUF551 domain-containing protein [Dysosmobacter welbionis]|uniref:DUF551 domain-containing protein n=1 Tax=Dysosmobacter welbionis TaxID=2093857 RepID=UPI002941FB48|nr:DUF551 domain-containing protein [Dysosmobacter welbionis]
MTTMDFSATLAALRRLRVETGSLVCFGCGHEHNCSTHGCAILRNAVEHMEAALSNYDSLSALVHHLETELKSEILSAAELRARLANEWVSVEERLPPEHEPVLCIVNGKPKPNITLEEAYQLGSWNKADGWIIDEYLDWEDAVVLWWMPLPEPPGKEG